MFAKLIQIQSLRRKLLLLTGGMTTLMFVLIFGYTLASFKSELDVAIARDIASKNRDYIHTVDTLFKDRVTTIMALRDDLERLDTRGQMWIYLAAHAGEKVFDDQRRGLVYADAYQRKLETYRANGQLSPDRMSPTMRRLLEQADTHRNAFGDGMRFFYIGVPSPQADPRLQAYDEYQDSSLWVPDLRVDPPYNPLVRPWYLAGQRAGRNSVQFTEPYAERRTGEAIVAGATAIRVEGQVGTLAAGISIKPIMETLLQNFDKRTHISIFSDGEDHDTEFVSKTPKYIYSSRDASLGEQFKAYNDANIIKRPFNRDVMALYDEIKGRESGVIEWTVGGDTRLVAFGTVPGVGWKLLSSVSKEEVFADAMRLQYRNMAIALLGLGIMLAALYGLITRELKPLDTITHELTEMAQSGDLSFRTTVNTHDELGKVARAINDMLDNTAGPVHELGVQVKKIAAGDASGAIHIDAKGDIAELVSSFNEMSRRLVELEETYRDASPLTGLPGGVSIESEVQRRIDARQPFVFCLFDLDNFKPFNDRYGYSRGNLVLKHLAQLITTALQQHGAGDDFVGHIGGDDFVLVAAPNRFKAVCEAVMVQFDATIRQFYDADEWDAGAIVGQDRRGNARVFPIMTLSIAAVHAPTVGRDGYIRVGEIAAELKSHAKAKPGSNLVIDQRTMRAAGDGARPT